MTTQQLNRDALDAQNEGRGLCRVLVWLGVAAWIALAVLACSCRHLPVWPVVEPEPSPDAVAFADLRWTFGGFDGSTASLADGVRIEGLRITSSGMRYGWASGGCEKLGAANAQDWTRTLACLTRRPGILRRQASSAQRLRWRLRHCSKVKTKRRRRHDLETH